MIKIGGFFQSFVKKEKKMINEIVYHKTMGKGTIIDVNTTENNIYISVAFENKTIEFNFPNAFECFLEAESDNLKVKVNEALAEKQKKKDEEERKKQKEKEKNELHRVQAELDMLERKTNDSKKQIRQTPILIGEQLIKGKIYGTVAKDIYEQGCRKFGWRDSEKGKFAKQQKLYSEIATPEGYSVWFLPHSNKTGTDNKSVKNKIFANKVEQWWFDNNHYIAPKRKRLMFYKEDNIYYFGGVYLFDEERIEETSGKIYYVEKFDLISEEYPEKNN